MGNNLSTRERILQEGLNLMSTSGFAGVTLGILAEKKPVYPKAACLHTLAPKKKYSLVFLTN